MSDTARFPELGDGEWYESRDGEYAYFMGDKAIRTRHPEKFRKGKGDFITVSDPKAKLVFFKKDAFFNVRVGKHTFLKVMSDNNVTPLEVIDEVESGT